MCYVSDKQHLFTIGLFCHSFTVVMQMSDCILRVPFLSLSLSSVFHKVSGVAKLDCKFLSCNDCTSHPLPCREGKLSTCGMHLRCCLVHIYSAN